MTCQRIKTPNGYAIVCGGRKNMSRVTPEEHSKVIEQQREQFIEKAKTVAIRAVNNWAPEANRLGLTVLSREFAHLGSELLSRIELQLETLKSGNVPKGFK